MAPMINAVKNHVFCRVIKYGCASVTPRSLWMRFLEKFLEIQPGAKGDFFWYVDNHFGTIESMRREPSCTAAMEGTTIWCPGNDERFSVLMRRDFSIPAMRDPFCEVFA